MKPTAMQIWNAQLNAIISKYTRGMSPEEFHATVDAHQMDQCTKQDCLLCRASAEAECLLFGTKPRESELLC